MKLLGRKIGLVGVSSVEVLHDDGRTHTYMHSLMKIRTGDNISKGRLTVVTLNTGCLNEYS